MSPEPLREKKKKGKKRYFVGRRSLSASMKLFALGFMENVQFRILFWTQQSHASCRAFSRRKVSGKRKRCHMAVRLLYAASNYLHQCSLTYKHLLKMPPESGSVFFPPSFSSFQLRRRGIVFALRQRSVNISKYCISVGNILCRIGK